MDQVVRSKLQILFTLVGAENEPAGAALSEAVNAVRSKVSAEYLGWPINRVDDFPGSSKFRLTDWTGESSSQLGIEFADEGDWLTQKQRISAIKGHLSDILGGVCKAKGIDIEMTIEGLHAPVHYVRTRFN